MAQIRWIDFTGHNAATGERVRTFSVNHPDAGRLVVIKGVVPLYDEGLQSLGFTQTRDGSWVIRAAQLNVGQLQARIFPGLGQTLVSIDDIDLTEEFVQGLSGQGRRDEPTTNSALAWLMRSATPTDEEATLSRYRGPIPSALAVALWTDLDENNPGERQPNGQIHYRGEVDGEAYVLQRRQRLLGNAEQVVFHSAVDARLLPELSASSQAPSLFRLSDSVAQQLREVGHYYSHRQGGEIHNHFSPSRNVADERGRASINATELLEGELVKAQLPVARPLVIADAEYTPEVSVGRLTEILGTDDAQALLGSLPASAWIVAPESLAAVAASPNASIRASALVVRPELTRVAAHRGFDSLVYYRSEDALSGLERDAFVDANGTALEVRVIDLSLINVVMQEPRINQSRIPDGFEPSYGRGEREGKISLVHLDTGHPVTFENEAWFSDVAAAVAATSAPENRHFLAPTAEDIASAIDDAFPETQDEPVIDAESTLAERTLADMAGEPPGRAALIAIRNYINEWADDYSIPSDLVERVPATGRRIDAALSDGGIQVALADAISELNEWLGSEVDDEHIADIRSLLSLVEAPLESADQPADPALAPETIASIAEGASRREERAAAQRAEWEAGADERLAEINRRQAVWTEHEGVRCLRINDEPYIGVPNNGRRNAQQWEIYNLNDRSDVFAFAKRGEVQDILYRAGMDLPAQVEAPAQDLSRGESVYQRLVEALVESGPDNAAPGQDIEFTADLAMPPADRSALTQYLRNNNYSDERKESVVTLTLSSETQPESIALTDDQANVRMERRHVASFDPAAVRETMASAIEVLRDNGTTLGQMALTFGADSDLYHRTLANLRGDMIDALKQIQQSLRGVRAVGAPMEDVVAGSLPDLVELGDPVVTELYDQIIDDDVPLTIEPLALTAPDLGTAPEPTWQALADDARITNEDQKAALDSLLASKTFTDAGLDILATAEGWEADFNGSIVATGAGAPNRGRVIQGLLTNLNVNEELNTTLYQEIRADESLVLEYQDLLDPIFSERMHLIRQQLAEAGYELDPRNPSILGPQREVAVRPRFDHAGAGRNVVGISWHVDNDFSIVDVLDASPEEIAHQLIEATQIAEAQSAEEPEQEPTNQPATNADDVNESDPNVEQDASSNVTSLFGDSPASPEAEDTVPAPEGVGRSVRLIPGANEKQFLVKFPGEQGRDVMEALGGKYIKKYDAYRFKKVRENRVRFTLENMAEDGTVQITDAIRQPVELKVGLVLSTTSGDYRTNMRVVNITPALGQDDYKVELSSPSDARMVFQDHTTARRLEQTYDVTITNWDALREQSQPDRQIVEDVLDRQSTEPDEAPENTPDRTPAEQFADAFDREYPIIRGVAYTRIGRNREGDMLYTQDAGVRAAITADQELHEEIPFVAETGDILPPTDRNDEFKTLAELTAETAVNNNVISLHGTPSADSEALTFDQAESESFESVLEERGIDPALMSEYLRSYSKYAVHAEREAENPTQSGEFIGRRIERTLQQAEDNLIAGAAEGGYSIDRSALVEAAKRVHSHLNNEAERLTSQIMAMAISRSIGEQKHIDREFAASLSPINAKIIPASWLNEKLDVAKRHGMLAAYAVVVAKSYGTNEDIDAAMDQLDNGTPETVQALVDRLDETYARARAVAELPACIDKLKSEIDSYHGVSPIPVDNMRRKLSGLYDKLARETYDIDSIPVEDADIQVYRESTADNMEFINLAERHGISVDAARLYAERVRNEIGARAHAEFLARPSTKIALDAAERLQATLPEGVIVRSSIGRPMMGEFPIKFTWGAGAITVGFPEEKAEGYSVHYRYDEQGRGADIQRTSSSIDYPALPTAEQIESATLSLAALYQTETRLYKAPEYGSLIESLAKDRYDNTLIAKQIRESIKAAIRAGDLPQGLKVSVRKASGSIHVEIKSLPPGFDLFTAEHIQWVRDGTPLHDRRAPRRYNREGAALLNAIEGYVDAYNFNNSDPMTEYYNVNYYSHVTFSDEVENAERERRISLNGTPDQDNTIYPLVHHEVYPHLSQLLEVGFTYVGSQRIGFDFNPGEPLSGSIVGPSGGTTVQTAPEMVVTHTGTTDPNTAAASEELRLAYNLLHDAFNLENRPFFAVEKAEPASRPRILGHLEKAVDQWNLSDAVEGGETFSHTLVHTGNGASLALSHSGHELTVETADEGIDAQVLVRVDTSTSGWTVLEEHENAAMQLANANLEYVVKDHEFGISDRVTSEPQDLYYSEEPGDSLRKDVLESRLELLHSNDMVPTPIGTPTDGAHFIGVRRIDGDRYAAALSSSMQAGDGQGVNIVAKRYLDRNDALAAVARALDSYVAKAYASRQAAGIVEGIRLLAHFEAEVGRDRFTSGVLQDSERAIAAKGGRALADYLEMLVDQGAAPAAESLTFIDRVSLPPVGPAIRPGYFELGQLANGRYVFGADLPVSAGEGKSFSLSTHNTSYPTPYLAVGAFLNAVEEYDKDIAIDVVPTYLHAIEQNLPVTARVPGRALPELSSSEIQSRLRELPDPISVLKAEQENTADPEQAAALIGEIDSLQEQLDDAHAAQIIDLIQKEVEDPRNDFVGQMSPEFVHVLAHHYPQLRAAWNRYNIQEGRNGTPPNPETMALWAEASGLWSTHEATAGGFTHNATLPALDPIAIASYQRNADADPVYRYSLTDLPSEAQATLLNQARVAGCVIEDDNVLFGSLEAVERFCEENDLRYILADQTVGHAAPMNTETRLSNVSPQLERDLNARGYIRTDEPNIWLTQTTTGASVRLTFFQGIDGDTIDARMNLGRDGRRLEQHFVGWEQGLDIDQLERAVNDHLANENEGPLVSPSPEPSINRITPEEVAQVLLGAGLNVSNQGDGTWQVNGDTYRYRHFLQNLGGEFRSVDHGKPYWVFKMPPPRTLAAAIAAHIPSMGTTQSVVDGYILRIEYRENDNCFACVLSQPGDDRELVLGAYSTLMSARTSTLSAIIDSDKLDNAWKQHYGIGEELDTSASLEPETETVASPSEPGTIENTEPVGSETQENDYVRQTERPTGRARGNAATPANASTDGQQPGVGDGSSPRGTEGLARSSGGADRRGAGPDSRGGDGSAGSAPEDRNGPTAEDSKPAERSAAHHDGQPLRDAEPRELFNLVESRASAGTTTAEKAEATLNALQTLWSLRQDERAATPGEKRLLSNMVGLGAAQFHGGSQQKIFGGYSNGDTAEAIRRSVRQFPSTEQESLKSTVLSAFYTPPALTHFMWDGLERMGVADSLPSLDMVEPAAGTGHFIGAAPEFVRNGANISAIECDPITAEIMEHLYPEARVVNKEFQDALFPANSKDLFIGNPPYGDVRLYNPNTNKREVIHDLFLRESVRATRPGGIVAFVTSSGTMDKAGKDMRQFVHTQADLVGGFRLPNSAFKEHAGTEVMTDVLFFRKRKAGEEPQSDDWVHSDEVTFETNSDPQTLRVNRYFINNPDRVLGELHATTSQFGFAVACKPGAEPLDARLQTALSLLPAGAFAPAMPERRRHQAALLDKDVQGVPKELLETLQIGNLYLADGEIRTLQYDGADAQYVSERAPIKTKHIRLTKDYIFLRDVVKQLVATESEPVNDEAEQRLTDLRAEANRLYEQFVKAHGPIGRSDTLKALRMDPDLFFVAQVEFYDQDRDQGEPADILKKRVIQATPEPSIDTPTDAIYASMSRSGYIDPAFVSKALGQPWPEIEETLGDAIYFDPEMGYHTTASVYLSGDVVAKREAAERALTHDRTLQRNIDALKDAAPKAIPITDVRIKLGAMWIPEDILSDFARKILKADNYSKQDKCHVRFSQLTNKWHIKATEAVLHDARVENTQEYGTGPVPFHRILMHCLEQTRPKVTIEVEDNRRVIDPEATQAARDKQDEVEEAFNTFVLEDPERAERMEQAYNYRMNRFVRPNADGRYLEFPGLTKELKGKPFAFGDHQLAAIERSITDPFGLLVAHEAGGGKTISSICAAMKNKQLGLANKPMIAVPNHMLVQFTREALEVYPNARVLTVSADDLTPEGRQSFAHKVRLNNWDLVICTHEQFKRLQMPDWYIARQVENEVSDLETMLLESDDRITTKKLEKQKKELTEKLKSLNVEARAHSDNVDFTELGIDWVGYDEAHYLKNRAFPTKNSSLAGVQSITSQRARDAEMKFDWIRESRGDDRGVFLATGTPISNTVGEIMVIMRYLAPKLLERAGIHNFDAFIAAFGETRVHIELTPDGSSYQMKERLSRFHNVPELMRLFTQVADIKMGEDLKLERPRENRVTQVSEMSPEQRLFMDWLTERAQAVKDHKVEPNEDNMLKIYSDLGTMSIDPRLYHHKLQDHADSKVNQQVDDIFRAWQEGAEDLNTQLIFCDQFQCKEKTLTGVSKEGKPKFKTTVNFNLYEDIKTKLVALGVPAEEIAFIHDAKSDDDKEALFANMRAGRVRICLASTAKMGVGTNVQTRLKDLRNLSYPMRSIDMEQRIKRAVRQGNRHPEVNVHLPTTKDSGDLARLQMIERKEQMTRQVMYCDFENMARSFDEDFSPSYEDIMAITTGNELIKEKLEIDTAVETLRRQARVHEQGAYRAKRDLHVNESRLIPNLRSLIEGSQELANVIAPEAGGFEMTIDGQRFTKAGLAGAEIHRVGNTLSPYDLEKKIGQYRGLPLLITRSNSDWFLTVEAPGRRIGVPITENLSHFPGQLGRKVRDVLDEAETLGHRIEHLQEENEHLRQICEKPFPHLEQLRDHEARQSEMSVKLAQLEQERASENDNGRDDGEDHPFVRLIQSLNGEAVSRTGLLNEEEIQSALDEEASDKVAEYDSEPSNQSGPQHTMF